MAEKKKHVLSVEEFSKTAALCGLDKAFVLTQHYTNRDELQATARTIFKDELARREAIVENFKKSLEASGLSVSEVSKKMGIKNWDIYRLIKPGNLKAPITQRAVNFLREVQTQIETGGFKKPKPVRKMSNKESRDVFDQPAPATTTPNITISKKKAKKTRAAKVRPGPRPQVLREFVAVARDDSKRRAMLFLAPLRNKLNGDAKDVLKHAEEVIGLLRRMEAEGLNIESLLPALN